MKRSLIDFFGWLGAVFIITAYALTSFSILKSSDIICLLLNIVGSTGVIVVSLNKKAYQPAIINIIWLLVAVSTLAFTALRV